MINMREVEEAIRELEQGSATYNNCMKLASLYVIRDELKKREGEYTQYTSHYTSYPRYEYSYPRSPMMRYDNQDLMIHKEDPMMSKQGHMM